MFNPEWPPAVAFVRSLGRSGATVSIYSNQRRPAAAWSRHAGETGRCPSVLRTDEFIDWLTARVESEEIELVAPTSDYINFAVAEVEDRLRIPGRLQGPTPEAVRRCIHKPSFVEALERCGYPGPATVLPTSADDAVAAGAGLGYPLLMKPRSHVGLGLLRGHVVHDEDELTDLFTVPALDDRHRTALRHDPALAAPMLQEYRRGPDLEVVSVSGCLAPSGEVLGLSHCRKLQQWPGALGIGTSFEHLGPQPFTERAIDAVRSVLGHGLFELEVIHDRSTGESWPIDLNPRAYGQITLAIAMGVDLPALWYEVMTGQRAAAGRPTPARQLEWTSGVQYYTEQLVHLATRPHRLARLAAVARHVRRPGVGAVMEWRDPLPGLVYALASYRHPRAMLRQFVTSEAPTSQP